jgi:ATP-dependent DNA helicase RecG
MFCATLAGFQTLLLAPTELLASQHYATLTGLSEQLLLMHQGLIRPRVALLTSSNKVSEKTAIKAALAEGHCDVLVSTQASMSGMQTWGRRLLAAVAGIT